jgi:hypothetical protein
MSNVSAFAIFILVLSPLLIPRNLRRRCTSYQAVAPPSTG